MQDILLTPQFITTFLIFAVCVAVFGGMALLERRPRDSLSPSLLPATPLMLLSGIVGLLALVHMLNLIGVHTGR